MNIIAAIGIVLIAASEARSTAKTSVPSIVAVGVHEDRARAINVGEDNLSIFADVWIWNTSGPVTSLVPPSDPQKALAESRRNSREVVVRIDGLAKEEMDDGEVLAGPLPMWQSIPEHLLPRFPVRRGTARFLASRDEWQVRYVGPRKGSWWHRLPGRTTTLRLPALPATARKTMIVSSDRAGVDSVLEIFPSDTRKYSPWASFSAVDGRVAIEPLPDFETIRYTARGRGRAPTGGIGKPSDIPARIELAPGASLSGRLVDEEGVPVPSAKIDLGGWLLSDSPLPFAKTAQTSSDGKFSFSELPRMRLVLTGARKGFVPLRLELDLAQGGTDLGDVELIAGEPLTIRVLDRDSSPVPDAEVRLREGVAVRTDKDGKAVIEARRDSAADLVVTHDDYLPRTEHLDAPLPESSEVVLKKPVVVEGRYVAHDGEPVAGPTLQIRTGARDRSAPISPDGKFRIQLEPAVETTLIFSGSNVDRLTIPIDAAQEGQRRDLGEIRAPRGAAVRGRILSAVDGTPVLGARVWSPRPSRAGAIYSWLTGDAASATTDANGDFRLTGLGGGSASLRIDAPGFARKTVNADLDPSSPSTDVGTVWLSEGVTMNVSTDVRSGTVVVDPTGQWNDLEFVRAQLHDGRAVIRNLPAGNALVVVSEGETIRCEKRVAIPESKTSLDVECNAQRMFVTGNVFVGARPATGGVLTWTRGDVAASEAVIINHHSQGGLRQQGVFGGGPPVVSVVLSSDGSFETDRLRPGPWDVRWMQGSANAPPVKVDVPAAETHAVRIDLHGGRIEGAVEDADGGAVAGARVIDLDGSAVAITDAGGRFVLDGIPPGVRRVQARTMSAASNIASVEIKVDVQTSPITLTLDEGLRDELDVAVIAADGSPAGGSFVIIESDRSGARIVTTDTSGLATATFAAGLTGRVRAAASFGGEWILGSWLNVDDLQDRLVLRATKTGSAVLRADFQGPVDVDLVGPAGWSLAALHRRIGVSLSRSELPLRMRGLPPGGYVAHVGGRVRSFSVVADRETVVDLSE